MDVTLPNGVVLEGVPDTASRDEIRIKAIQAGLATAQDFPAPKRTQAQILSEMKQNPMGGLEQLNDRFAGSNTDFSFTEAAKNLPGSIWNFGKTMVQPLIQPVDTAKAVGNVVMGAGEKLIPGVQEHEVYANQVANFFKDRYGSMDKVKRTTMQDPMGVAADFSGLLMGVPGVTNLGMVADPVNLARNTTKAAVGKMTGKQTPQNLYESAAKWSTTLPDHKRRALSQTALDHKIMPTTKGVNALDAKISGLNQQLDSLITEATTSGKTIPKGAVMRHLKDLRQKKGGPLLEAEADLKAIDRVAKRFDENLKRINKDTLTPQELQSLKLDAYEKINWDAKRMTGSPVREDTYKAIARGAKDSIEDLVPGVGPTNKQLGPLYELQPHLQRSANRIGNRNVVSLNAPLNIGAGSTIGGPLGTAVGAGVSILEIPQVKARLALWLNQAKQQGLLGNLFDNNLATTATRQGLFQTGRMSEQQ